ncbi:mucin-19 [Musca vetustissima]|uniref:mucin-19 n=1 Tax=Musca vetustissima TaxID=27455 RepID=UPI002AB6F84E|nr:mucin-19 [Musca vetustissima]
MSEKNGQGAAVQWTKAGGGGGATTGHKQHQQIQQGISPIYNANVVGVPLGLTTTAWSASASLYGATNHISGGSGSQHDVVSYASARFQAPPPLEHSSAASSSHPAIPHSASSSSNVPVPSGFVPPSFAVASSATAAAAATTSVLTPNPYSAPTIAAQNTLLASTTNPHGLHQSAALASQQFPGQTLHGPFGMDQFQHLNVQQQFELSKLMAAATFGSNQIAASIGPTNLTSSSNSASGGPLISATTTTTSTSTTASALSPSISQSSSSRQPHTTPSIPFANTGGGGGDMEPNTSVAGAISNQLAEQVINTISTGSSGSKLAPTPIHGRLMGLGVNAPDEEKLRRIQEVVEWGISDHAKQQIVQILDRISTLRPVEKLLLYLRLPGEQPETDPLRQPQNPLGTRSEINHTINWVRTHLEQDPQVSIPKQDVYNDYLVYCERLNIKPLSTADFGKVMKQVFPGIRPRRLGTRGHSRYCYAAMRKTSKLPAPHLPTLTTTTAKSAIKGETNAANESGDTFSDKIDEDQEESWSVIKQWAENVLHVKVNDVNDLANQIKANVALPQGHHTSFTAAGTTKTGSHMIHKKYAQREPKEKRVMADMGPLKKRRKKKRKGSSSSESSCHQTNTAIEQGSSGHGPQLSPANSSKGSSQRNPTSPLITAADDGQKLLNATTTVKIKQEIVDSPGFGAATSTIVSAHSTDTDSAKHIPIYHHQHPHINQQSQQQPINLAAETRGGGAHAAGIGVRPTSASLTGSAFEHVRSPAIPTNSNSSTTTAVKNLTPKIMELAVENQPTQQTSATIHNAATIKQEVGVDDYQTTNIFCKKVRKAQESKSFWPNSPTSNNRTTSLTVTSASRPVLPIITTTASTPPPVAASVITSPNNNEAGNNNNSSALGPSAVVVPTCYSMGPPAQMAPSTSPNNHHEDAMGQPKVVSRNLQQLRAKKLLGVNPAACDPPDLSAAVKDAADLPENLGLPRERVISICNMDKHELDDYFLPEEENSEDQETELLQYFQMGDAEEKLTKNSSSDAKRHSYPTVTPVISNTTLTSSASSSCLTTVTMMSGATTSSAAAVGAAAARQTLTTMNASNSSIKRDSSTNNEMSNFKPATKQLSQQALNYLKSSNASSSLFSANNNSSSRESCGKFVSSSKHLTSAVGTASASLEHLTQKHHQQQQLLPNQQQLQQPPQPPVKVSYKRKINLNASSSSDITAARKNYIFEPISPNINSTSTTSSGHNTGGNGGGSHSTNTGFFASPHFSRQLTKQQSLDSESSSDPMIGATRRRRTYMTTMTSASAPPSPSVLKQQHEQQLFALSNNIFLEQWPTATNSSSVFNSLHGSNQNHAAMLDQNSLDLDLFAEAAAATATASSSSICASQNQPPLVSQTSLKESETILNDLTQRSRSVPLSQLQRSHSPTFNRAFQLNSSAAATAYSACNSLAQTPIPTEFIDSVTMLSENSCSQQSSSIKLEEVGGNVVGSDSTALLDEVDVNEILSSPDFGKFSRITQSGGSSTGTKTSCSSAGSSSGYSSAGQFSLSLSSYGGSNGNGVGGAIMSSTASISRSVPSTPLPHQNPSCMPGNGNSFYRRRFANNCQPLGGNYFSSTGKYGYGNMNTTLSRSACDISKSMPSTPITTTPSSFRYSPTEFTRDFLINGNTIDDSLTSSFGTVGTDNLMGSDVVGVDAPLLNEEDSLINGSRGDNDVISPDFCAQTAADSSILMGNNSGLGGSAVAAGVSSTTTGSDSNLPEEQVKRKRRLKPQKSHDSIMEENILENEPQSTETDDDDDDDVDNDNNGAMSLLLAEVGKL